jgi:hypothetical protein
MEDYLQQKEKSRVRDIQRMHDRMHDKKKRNFISSKCHVNSIQQTF